jgi:glycosyltransferase involved in cell wall biosynthesis
MKIAVWHNLPSGGGKRALYYHVRGLVQRGHTVESWCSTLSDREYLPLSEFGTEHVLPLEVKTSRLTKLTARSEMLQRELNGNLLAELRALNEHCRRCAEEINAGGFDVLLANSSMIMGAASIGRYVDTAKVLYLQEPSRGLYEAGPDGLLWKALPPLTRPWTRPRYVAWSLINEIGIHQLRILAREELTNAKAFDRILVNSFFSRESLLRAYGLDVTVCYLGIDTNLFVDQHKTREPFVVSLGEFRPHKRPEFVIRSMATIPQLRPHLVWISNNYDGPYLESMESLAKSLEVSLEVRTRLNDTDLVEALNRAAAMAYAPRLEPFGFAPLEANACGLAVVAVAEGGVRETIKDGVNGLLVAHDPEAMGNAIGRLLQDRSYADQLGRRGHQIVTEQWSVDAAVTRLEQELKAIAAGKTLAQTLNYRQRNASTL